MERWGGDAPAIADPCDALRRVSEWIALRGLRYAPNDYLVPAALLQSMRAKR
jgi:hypothetical protein